jgi:hypothetical protein
MFSLDTQKYRKTPKQVKIIFPRPASTSSSVQAISARSLMLNYANRGCNAAQKKFLRFEVREVIMIIKAS